MLFATANNLKRVYYLSSLIPIPVSETVVFIKPHFLHKVFELFGLFLVEL
jgi:hypothetical protein